MTHWYFVRDGHREGPVSPEFIADELRAGHLGPQDRVWAEGFEEWKPISEVPELADLARAVPPPLPKLAHAPEPVSVGTVAPSAASPTVYALLRWRAAAMLLDQLILVVPGLLLGLGVLGYLHTSNEGFDVSKPEDYLKFQETIYMVGMFANWLYCVGFEASRFQGTPGMLLLGLRVTTDDGRQMTYFQATARHIVRSFTWYIGWIPALMTPRRQTLHDVVAATVVTTGHPRPPRPRWMV